MKHRVLGVLVILIVGLTIAVPVVMGMLLDYQVKMRALDVAEKAVQNGLELRLNGDILDGIDLRRKKDD